MVNVDDTSYQKVNRHVYCGLDMRGIGWIKHLWSKDGT